LGCSQLKRKVSFLVFDLFLVPVAEAVFFAAGFFSAGALEAGFFSAFGAIVSIQLYL